MSLPMSPSGTLRPVLIVTGSSRQIAVAISLTFLLSLAGTCEAEAEAPREEAGETTVAEKSDEPIAPPVTKAEKLVIGATAEFREKSSGLVYTARIDTGATTCSVHAEDIRVEGGGKKMLKNIGKKVSFALLDADGAKKRVESVIVTTVRVKTSEEKERRYKVWLTLSHAGVERRVHVTLNDRAHMEYPLLIGRNYLRGKFLVDVSEKHSPLAAADAGKDDQGNATPNGSDEPIASQDGTGDKKANL